MNENFPDIEKRTLSWLAWMQWGWWPLQLKASAFWIQYFGHWWKLGLGKWQAGENFQAKGMSVYPTSDYKLTFWWISFNVTWAFKWAQSGVRQGTTPAFLWSQNPSILRNYLSQNSWDWRPLDMIQSNFMPGGVPRSRWHRNLSRWVLNVLRERDSMTFLGSLFRCSCSMEGRFSSC